MTFLLSPPGPSQPLPSLSWIILHQAPNGPPCFHPCPHRAFSTQRVLLSDVVRCHHFSTQNPPGTSHLPLSKTKVQPLPPPLNPFSLSSLSRLVLKPAPASGTLHPLCPCQATLYHSSEGLFSQLLQSLLKCHLLSLSPILIPT